MLAISAWLLSGCGVGGADETAAPGLRVERAALEIRHASIEARAGNFEQAAAVYRSALELLDQPQDPYRALIGLELGNALENQGEYEEAAEWYRRALVLSAGEDGAAERDDGLLHGWEILEIPTLAAELVTLAGCETGRGAEWPENHLLLEPIR